MADYPTGNRPFLESDARNRATCEANRADARDRSLGRFRCSLCGTVDGWEDWDRQQVKTARDSILLVFAVRLTTRWGETILHRIHDCRDWSVKGELVKALREGTTYNPLPKFYRRDGDAEHLYTRCPQCRPSVDRAVAVGMDEVQEWLEGGL